MLIRRNYFIYCSHWHAAFYHPATLLNEDFTSEWYRVAFAKMLKLSCVLENVEHVDGRVIDFNRNSVITDDNIISHMRSFNYLARSFIGVTLLVNDRKKLNQAVASRPLTCFNNPSERNCITLNSLTKLCDFLKISAQQRKSVRLTVCPQVTQHHVWRESLLEVLKDLIFEMDFLDHDSQEFYMAKQIASSCIKFFSDTVVSTPSWMQPAPLKKIEKPLPGRKWEEVLEMITDLTKCLKNEERLVYHVSKLESMKEGLCLIKDILIDKDISFKELRRQDCLVQKKLSKCLGHSSKCLFTLLLYYLHGSVRDIEVEVSGGLYNSDGKFSLCIGKIITSDHNETILNAVKQLSRALGVFHYVWQTANMNEALGLQGHIWCLGATERTLTYRGNVFYIHGIRLSDNENKNFSQL